MATNTRKLASLLGASGAGIANDGTLTSAAIGEVIVAGDIAADAVGTAELANDVAISTTGAIAGTGGLTMDGATVFNEASADVDFRVESNGNANMLVVDASADKVGIGVAAPDRELTVGGVANARIGILTTDASSGASQVQFGDPNDSQIGRVMYEHDNNRMTFHTNGTERMRIGDGAVGTVTCANNPKWYYSGSTSGTGTGVRFHDGVELFDVGNNCSLTTIGGQANVVTFVAPVTGKYWCSVSTIGDATAATTPYRFVFRVNDVQAGAQARVHHHMSGNHLSNWSFSIIVAANSGQTICAAQDMDNPRWYTTQFTYFCGFLVP